MDKPTLSQNFSNVLLVSMPVNYKAVIINMLPGAHIDTKELSQVKTQKYKNINILSVFIHDLVNKNTLSKFPQLEAVVTRSAGYDHLPLDWMKKHKIAGYYLGDYSTEGVSEFTLSLILALLRRISEGCATTKELKWDRSNLINQSLNGTTIGVLGTGKIGAAVVSLLLALGAHVIGYDIIQNSQLKKLKKFRYISNFKSFLSQSSVLTIHVSLNSYTKNMIDWKALKSLPKGAYVVNTSRGGVIDQAAMEKALQSEHIAGYATDVLPGEPHPSDLKRFKNLSNVILTPHLAAYDKNTIHKRYKYTNKVIRALLSRNQKTLKQFRIV